MNDSTYSPLMLALFGPPTLEQRLEWLDGICSTMTATQAQIVARDKLRLKLARHAASEAFKAAAGRYGEAAARQAFVEAVDREVGRPGDQRFNDWLLETYDWIKDASQNHGVRKFRKRAVELVSIVTGKSEEAVERQLQRLLDQRKAKRPTKRRNSVS